MQYQQIKHQRIYNILSWMLTPTLSKHKNNQILSTQKYHTNVTYHTLKTHPISTLQDEHPLSCMNSLDKNKIRTDINGKKKYLDIATSRSKMKRKINISRVSPKNMKKDLQKKDDKSVQLKLKKNHQKQPKYGRIQLFRALETSAQKNNDIYNQTLPASLLNSPVVNLNSTTKLLKNKSRKGIELSLSKEKYKKEKKKSIEIEEIKGGDVWEDRVFHYSLQLLHQYASVGPRNQTENKQNKQNMMNLQNSRMVMKNKQMEYVKNRHIKLIISPNKSITVR